MSYKNVLNVTCEMLKMNFILYTETRPPQTAIHFHLYVWVSIKLQFSLSEIVTNIAYIKLQFNAINMMQNIESHLQNGSFRE